MKNTEDGRYILLIDCNETTFAFEHIEDARAEAEHLIDQGERESVEIYDTVESVTVERLQ